MANRLSSDDPDIHPLKLQCVFPGCFSVGMYPSDSDAASTALEFYLLKAAGAESSRKKSSTWKQTEQEDASAGSR